MKAKRAIYLNRFVLQKNTQVPICVWYLSLYYAFSRAYLFIYSQFLTTHYVATSHNLSLLEYCNMLWCFVLNCVKLVRLRSSYFRLHSSKMSFRALPQQSVSLQLWCFLIKYIRSFNLVAAALLANGRKLVNEHHYNIYQGRRNLMQFDFSQKTTNRLSLYPHRHP